MEKFVGALYDGLTLGAIYALIAVGYTMVYGIIRLINFAHGEVIMVGTFLALLISGRLVERLGPASIAVAVPAAMVCCAGLGAMLDWAAYLPLRRRKRFSDVVSVLCVALTAVLAIAYFLTKSQEAGAAHRWIAAALLVLPGVFVVLVALDHFHVLERPQAQIATNRLNALIVAIGMSLCLQTLAQLIWGAHYRSFPAETLPAFLNEAPDWLSFGAVSLQWKQLIVWGTTLSLMLGLGYLVNRTRIGRAMRASALDTNAAALMGVNVDRVILITFMIGSALAAVAGALLALKVGGNINYRMGYYPGVIAFAAAVLGGIGHINGAVVGGMMIGLAQTFGMTYISSELDFVFGFGIMVLVITIRPWGLFGRPDAARA